MSALDGYSLTALDKMPAQQLYALALDKLSTSPDIVSDLSYVGHFYCSVARVSATKAGQQFGIKDIADLAAAAPDVLAKVWDLVKDIAPEIAAQLAAAVGSTIVEAIPLIGQAVGAILEVAAAEQALTDSWNADEQNKCKASYRPTATGTGYGGAHYPCDFIAGQVGDVFAVADQSYEATGGKWHDKTIKPQPGIDPERRRLLGALRLVIKKSRNDPTMDGGVALWPVYMDLLWAEHEKGNWNLDQVFYDFAMYVLPPLRHYAAAAAAPTNRPGDCALFERRAFDEFKAAMTAWKLTIDPVYVQDRSTADDLKVQIAAAEAKLLAPPHIVIVMPKLKAPLPKIRVPLLDVFGPPKPPTTAVVVSGGLLAGAAGLAWWLGWL